MSARLRHALVAVAIVALALLSHGRLFRAGWLGDDLRLLQQSQTALSEHGASSAWLDEGRVRPVPSLVLGAHERLFQERGFFSSLHARSLRIVSMVLLLAAAAMAGFALRRSLATWVGGDTARAAGFALALFFATHPLGTAAVARPAALGDLFALFFTGLSAFLFLRGRQQREKHWVVLAGAAAVFAGFSSAIALLLPFVLCALELGSARRPRPFSQRVRTALTTLCVFAGCVLVENVCAAFVGLPARRGFAGALPGWPTWSDAPQAIEACVEKLGILFLPVANTHPYNGILAAPPSTWPSYLLSVALVLLATWPVLRSARAAPRMWGWFGLTWILGMAIALVPHADVRVEPGDYTHAHLLIGATMFACAGLAVASTALLGTRRILLPATVAIGFAWLGAQAAGAFVTAGRHVEDMHRDLEKAFDEGGSFAHVLFVDPAVRAANLDLGLDDADLLADRQRAGKVSKYPPHFVAEPALELLSRTPEFAHWRSEGLVVVVPNDPANNADDPARDEPTARALRLVAPTEGQGPPVTWQHKSQSGVLDLDPAATHAARFVAQAGTSTAEAPRISWRASGSLEERFELIGVWLEGQDAPVAVFDFSKSPEWRQAASVRNVSIVGSFWQVVSAELLADIPLGAEGPRVRGDDWTFQVGGAELARPVRGEAQFTLDVIDLSTLEFARIEIEPSKSEAGLVLNAPGAAGFERKVRAHGGGPLFWSLDRSVGGTTLARSSGRQ